MRWKKRRLPFTGDKRTILRFLYWPKELNGEIRWLEFSYILQEFEGFNNIMGNWIDLKWVDKEPRMWN